MTHASPKRASLFPVKMFFYIFMHKKFTVTDFVIFFLFVSLQCFNLFFHSEEYYGDLDVKGLAKLGL